MKLYHSTDDSRHSIECDLPGASVPTTARDPRWVDTIRFYIKPHQGGELCTTSRATIQLRRLRVGPLGGEEASLAQPIDLDGISEERNGARVVSIAEV